MDYRNTDKWDRLIVGVSINEIFADYSLLEDELETEIHDDDSTKSSSFRNFSILFSDVIAFSGEHLVKKYNCSQQEKTTKKALQSVTLLLSHYQLNFT